MPEQFSASFSDLPKLLAAVRAVCRGAGLAGKDTLRAELAIEEAFSNSIRHGYGGERPDQRVWLTGQILLHGARLVYEDEAPAFDPLNVAPSPRQGPGGAGCLLLKTLPTTATYRRQGERNILTLDFAAGAPA